MATKNLLGIFDSGIGGFSVYKEIRKNTTANILYYGDCARAPYGNKSEEEIVLFIKEILYHLQEQGVTHFVSACNSMSVLTTKALLKELIIEEEKYFDMISAVASIPFQLTNKVLIIGTVATVRSGVYQHILKEKGILFEVYSPTSLAGDIEQHAVTKIVDECEKTISFAQECKATHILYACTHYPLAHQYFLQAVKIIEWKGSFIDPAVYLGEVVSSLGITGENQSTFEASFVTEAFATCVKNVSI